MNNLVIFSSTNVQGSGIASSFGNTCLTPVRYLFHGKTVEIVSKELFQEVHHVSSFHKSDLYCSKSNSGLKSASTGFLQTVAAIITLIPGLFIGAIFKGLSYLSKSTRDQHALIKEHFKPIDKTIGSAEKPLVKSDIRAALRCLGCEPLHQKIHALTIYGANVQLNTDPGFLELNPKKVIFVGAKIVHEPTEHLRLDELLSGSKKWKRDAVRVVTASESGTFVDQIVVKSVDEALTHQTERRPRSSKRYHGIYVVAKL